MQYLLVKFGWMILTIFIITAITFMIFNIFPEANISAVCGKPCSVQDYQDTRHLMGLDVPLWEQFWNFLQGIFVGRSFGGEAAAAAAITCSAPCLGYSFLLNQSVTDLVVDRMGVTVSIAIVAAVMWLILGIGLGLVAAVKQGKWQDKLIQGLEVVSI
ncbi:MAG: ABC transporter permease, partial [Candidatus Ancillula sp.]|nr:ABC transporter permease [Candidatus Ancillula sp.]